jgi:DNA polymerase IV
MPSSTRAIIHLDLDAFYASVEVLENPALAGQPVLIGGHPEGRGVVAAASYPARAFGVRSAMPMARALVLCPEAIVLPARFSLCREYSQRVMDILRRATPLFEQTSIDEAYLDVTEQTESWEAAVELARQLQRQVREEVGLSASLGVASNKLVAKVASDHDKPAGLTVVRPGQEASFLAPLPVRVLWGVGPVMAQKLAEVGATTVGDLASIPEEELRQRFGKHGAVMVRHAHGIDRRPVVTERRVKSVSQERTFRRDVIDLQVMHEQLDKMSERVAGRLTRKELVAGTIGIKLRYSDFTTLTRQMTLAVPTADQRIISKAASTLLERNWHRGRAVRLLGVSARRLSEPAGQLPLL